MPVLPPSSVLPTPAVDPLVVQHNALVNACFTLNTLELRLVVRMLGRLHRTDSSFVAYAIPVRELAAPGGTYVPYTEVPKMVQQLARRAIDIEPLDAAGKRQKGGGFVSVPLLSRVSYEQASGYVVARFSEAMRPYLLELTHTFTKAESSQLLKLKSIYAYRIYWLLKEKGDYGHRTLSVAELRSKLQLTTEYAERFDHFRTRVLDRAQRELAQTDLPFTYELLKRGREIVKVRFCFAPPQPVASNAPQVVRAGWEQSLLTVGVSERSIKQINAQLAAGQYDEGYIVYVLTHTQQRQREGKIKRLAGAVYKALTEGYLLARYRSSQGTQVSPSATAGKRPALQDNRVKQRRKQLTDELEDAHTSLRFHQEPGVLAKQHAGDRVRQGKTLTTIADKITALTQALLALDGPA